MKKDSNMFNDNSIETEGIPADKTAEIPKVVDSTEEENAKKPLVLFGREFSRKQVCAAGAGILCAALLIGGGAYAISHASWTGDSNAPAVSQSKDDEKQDMVLTLEVKADGWDADTSTPVIAHIEDADGEVDFYTAIAANKQVTVKVGKSGTYTVTFISPVNADGSIYKVSSKKVTAGKADKKTASTGVTFNKVDADKVTKDDLTAIAKEEVRGQHQEEPERRYRCRREGDREGSGVRQGREVRREDPGNFRQQEERFRFIQRLQEG